jgi:hypothetical protein
MQSLLNRRCQSCGVPNDNIQCAYGRGRFLYPALLLEQPQLIRPDCAASPPVPLWVLLKVLCSNAGSTSRRLASQHPISAFFFFFYLSIVSIDLLELLLLSA